MGHAASRSKDTALVMAAFATVAFPLSGMGVFHTDRGSGFGNDAIGGTPGVFGTARPPSKRGCPLDSAVDEPTNKPPEAELVWGEEFGYLSELQARPSEYVWWYNNDRLHSKPDYMSPVEFRLAGLSL